MTMLQVDGTWVIYTSKKTIKTNGCRAGTTFGERTVGKRHAYIVDGIIRRPYIF